MDALLVLIGLVCGAVIGALVTGLLVRRRSTAGPDPELVEARRQNEVARVRQEEADARARLAESRAEAVARAEALGDQVRQLQEQQQRMLERSRAENEERLARERAESKVLQALAPVRETLTTMQKKVADLEGERSKQYGEITEQLREARVSGEQLRSTTESLASALRSNSVRGAWGETQLQRLVEVAGLTQYVDFDVQQSISSDAGAGRPDMVIRLPGGKSIAVDSKVPLESYLEASEIPFTATGEEAARRTRLIDKHVKAVRGHIDALAKKRYWEGLQPSPEFVIAFIPSESLLSSALEADPALLDYSFDKHVALASPVNLWAVLKTIAYTWQQQAVTDEARTLFELGTTLYQRLGTLAEHADGLRRAIQRTVDSYNKFANSLESRVLVTARRFPGINESKIIAEPETVVDAPRRLTAVELELGDALPEGEETQTHFSTR